MNYFNYFTEIEETFIRRRGKHLFLSPLDWALIESWEKRGIPVRIVLRGIENVFDRIEKNPGRLNTVKSIGYCRDEIESLYNDWQASQVGKDVQIEPASPSPAREDKAKLFSALSIDNHLKKIIDDIEKARSESSGELQLTLAMVQNELREYIEVRTEPELHEEKLSANDELIDSVLLKSCDPVKLGDLKNEIVVGLSDHKAKMTDDVYRRTFDLMLSKRLREESKIPRLSLFFL